MRGRNSMCEGKRTGAAYSSPVSLEGDSRAGDRGQILKDLKCLVKVVGFFQRP